MKNVILITALAITGCASHPSTMQPTHVSQSKYDTYSCEKLYLESEDTSERISDLEYILTKKASDDTAQMTIGLIIFWPALLFLEGGDHGEAMEFSRLNGNYNAMAKVNMNKECGRRLAVIKVKHSPITQDSFVENDDGDEDYGWE